MPLPDLGRFDQLIGDRRNENGSSNEVLTMQCCDSSPRRLIAHKGHLGDRESDNECSNEALTMHYCDPSPAGENTVFFA